MVERRDEEATSGFTRGLILMVTGLVIVDFLACGSLFYVMMPQSGGDKASAARYGIAVLTEAVEIYKLNNGAYPESLDLLAQPQPGGWPPLATADSLIDPWGQPYGYELAGPKN